MTINELSKAHNWNLPTSCPVCGGEFNLSENHKKLSCINDFCLSKYSGRIAKWVSVLGIKELGLTTIEKLIDAGIIDTISSLYYIDYSKIEKLEGFGKRSAENIKKEIESHKKMSLAKFIAGYNICGIGERVIQTIIEEKGYKDIADFWYAESKDFVCKSVGTITADILYTGLRALYDDMVTSLRNVEIIEENKPNTSGSKLNGKSFCFTGAMKNKRKDLEQMVSDNGGIVHDGIKKNPLTDYLVIADVNSTSSKAVAARKLGVNLISEDDFLGML